MYRRALAASGVAIALSLVAMSPMFAASASTGPAVVAIADVQGTGATTPLAGRTVVVHGVVTAVLPGLGGLYVQSATSSGIAGASDGIFVSTKNVAFSAGDLVSVSGVAREVKTQTELGSASVTLIQAGAGLPAVTALPDSTEGAAREALEGMLVAPAGSYYLDATENSTGSLLLSAGSATGTAANHVLLDDGTDATVSTQPFLLSDTVIRPGDTLVAPARGLVLGAGASGYRLEPVVQLKSSTGLAYKARFTAVSPRLGSAPTLAP